ncbi:MAG: hypothetical protein SPI49_03430 [Eubacteriales bacterium]|nr:hypothetical protein [Eubacteriales bacterium]
MKVNKFKIVEKRSHGRFYIKSFSINDKEKVLRFEYYGNNSFVSKYKANSPWFGNLVAIVIDNVGSLIYDTDKNLIICYGIADGEKSNFIKALNDIDIAIFSIPMKILRDVTLK